MPIVTNIYKVYMKWLDPGKDAFHSQLVATGRIPLVSQMMCRCTHMRSKKARCQCPAVATAGHLSPLPQGVLWTHPAQGCYPLQLSATVARSDADNRSTGRSGWNMQRRRCPVCPAQAG